MAKKRRGQSAAFMRSINPHLHRKVNKGNSSNNSMARRRRTSVRRTKRKSYSRGMGSVTPILLGAGIYLLYDAYLKPKVPLQGVALSGAEFLAGWYLHKKSGLVGDFGKILMIVGALGGESALLQGVLGGTSSGGGVFY
jgi:hypothetical protein